MLLNSAEFSIQMRHDLSKYNLTGQVKKFRQENDMPLAKEGIGNFLPKNSSNVIPTSMPDTTNYNNKNSIPTSKNSNQVTIPLPSISMTMDELLGHFGDQIETINLGLDDGPIDDVFKNFEKSNSSSLSVPVQDIDFKIGNYFLDQYLGSNGFGAKMVQKDSNHIVEDKTITKYKRNVFGSDNKSFYVYGDNQLCAAFQRVLVKNNEVYVFDFQNGNKIRPQKMKEKNEITRLFRKMKAHYCVLAPTDAVKNNPLSAYHHLKNKRNKLLIY